MTGSVRLRHVLSPSAQWTTRRVKWTLLTFVARTSLISWIKSTTTLSCTISSVPMSWPAGYKGQVQILMISNITNAWSVLLNKCCRGWRKAMKMNGYWPQRSSSEEKKNSAHSSASLAPPYVTYFMNFSSQEQVCLCISELASSCLSLSHVRLDRLYNLLYKTDTFFRLMRFVLWTYSQSLQRTQMMSIGCSSS